MEIGDWKATPNLNKVYGEIRRLGLEKNVAELEAYGFTIVEPGKAAPLLHRPHRRKGSRGRGAPQRRRSPGNRERSRNHTPIGDLIYHMLWEDRIFEEAAHEPGRAGPDHLPARRKLHAAEHDRQHQGADRGTLTTALRQRNDSVAIPALRPGRERHLGAQRLHQGEWLPAVGARQPPALPPSHAGRGRGRSEDGAGRSAERLDDRLARQHLARRVSEGQPGYACG